MSPRHRRVVITLAVLSFAAGVVLLTFMPRPPPQPDAAQPGVAPSPGAATLPDGERPPAPSAPPVPSAGAPPPGIDGLHARWVPIDDAPEPLGSLDARQAMLFVEPNPIGAGLDRITLSGHWQTAADSRKADAHYEALGQGSPNPPELPAEDRRYVLKTAQELTYVVDGRTLHQTVPVLAAHSLVINGTTVPLLKEYTDESGTRWCQWRQTGRGAFEAIIVDAEDTPVARVTRRYELADSYDITLEQSVTNLTDAPLEIQWIQYGPGDLIPDWARYIDIRHFLVGYQPDPARYPGLIIADKGDFMVTRAEAIKRDRKARAAADPLRRQELRGLWPTAKSQKNGYRLSWFASTNRYFALAVHPPLGDARVLSLDDTVLDIRLEVDVSRGKDNEQVFTGLSSPIRSAAPGEELRFDLGAYAGPLDREILGHREPMASLNMRGLILYQMSSFCAACTFQWLAVALLWFLSAVHVAVADWGLAIILLVVVVRALLHPLTKKSQIHMQRFGKVMGDLKPEVEKLQKKYPDDPKKVQQEQMRLYRERGISPFQFLGCLPMFLQMPIWIALYAMLYFAIELRHQPAFWGVFQVFWNWPFLDDLSAADHFFWQFSQPRKLIWLNITGINLLPILMGLVFFIQQKYMSPPPSPQMTKEQLQQQKIMKVMMVVMFPVLLYSAPSGLTLYIFTSSLIGIIESRYIRRHITEMDLAPAKPKTGAKAKKPRDLQARLFASAIERVKKKRQPPPKRYKRRR